MWSTNQNSVFKMHDVARERVRFAPFAGEPIGWLIEQLGPEMLCFASDYPHPEGSSDPIRKFEATMENVDSTAVEAFYAGNVERFLGDIPVTI